MSKRINIHSFQHCSTFIFVDTRAPALTLQALKFVVVPDQKTHARTCVHVSACMKVPVRGVPPLVKVLDLQVFAQEGLAEHVLYHESPF